MSDEEDEMQITIEQSPYGDTGKVYNGPLGMMQHFRLQLISFRPQNKTPAERAHLDADIAGYEAIIASGSQKNARAFMEHKRDKNNGERFANNLEVIKWLKANGLWEEAKRPSGGES